MEGDAGDLHPQRFNPRQQLRREMQAGGRGRRRAAGFGVDRLVALPLLRRQACLDIRRQRGM